MNELRDRVSMVPEESTVQSETDLWLIRVMSQPLRFAPNQNADRTIFSRKKKS